MRINTARVVVLSTTLLLACELFAGRFRPITFQEMMEYTDVLVRADIREKESLYKTICYIDDWGRVIESERIYTRYRLNITDVLYGQDHGTRIDVYFPRGTVDGIGEWNSAVYQLGLGWDIVIHLKYDKLNDIVLAAGTPQTIFLAQEVQGQEVFVNLSDARWFDPDRESLSNLRRGIALDDWVRPRDAAPVTYEALKAVFRGQDR